jgi:hypothetical protein
VWVSRADFTLDLQTTGAVDRDSLRVSCDQVVG